MVSENSAIYRYTGFCVHNGLWSPVNSYQLAMHRGCFVARAVIDGVVSLWCVDGLILVLHHPNTRSLELYRSSSTSLKVLLADYPMRKRFILLYFLECCARVCPVPGALPPEPDMGIYTLTL